MKKIHKNILIIIAIAYGIVIFVFLLLPEDNVIVPKGNANEHYVQGIIHYQKGQYDQAISELDKTTKIEPRDIQAYRYRGLAYVEKGELDEAILNFTQAIEKDPRSSLDYIHRGNTYRAKQEYELALRDYTKAIEINSKSVDAYMGLARTYKAKGEPDLATKNQKKAIELEAEKRYSSAEFFYERFKKRGDKPVGSESDYHYENGKWIYKPTDKRYESDMAISDYTMAIELNPKYSKAYINLADIYYMKKNYDKAWENVHNAENLGHQVPPEFLEKLREASGREE